jgi:actin-related protein
MTDNSIVAEISSRMIRLGFSGQEEPWCSLMIDFPQNNFDTESTKLIIYEKLMHIFNTLFPIKTKDYRILIVEKFFCREEFRKILMKILLVNLQFQSVSFQPDILMASLVSIKYDRNALIVDIGHSETRILAFSHGRPIIKTTKFAGVGVSNFILSFKSKLETFRCEQIDYNKAAQTFESIYFKGLYSNVNIMKKFEFPPDLYKFDDDDLVSEIAQCLLDCLHDCQYDYRLLAARNIIFCGGGAIIYQLCDAICNVASTMCKDIKKYNKSVANILSNLSDGKFKPAELPFNRSLLAWIGGSIFSSLQSNNTKYINLTEYKSKENLLGIFDWMSLEANHKFTSMNCPL